VSAMLPLRDLGNLEITKMWLSQMTYVLTKFRKNGSTSSKVGKVVTHKAVTS